MNDPGFVRVLAGIAAIGLFVGAGAQIESDGATGTGPFSLFCYGLAALSLMFLFPWPKEPRPPSSKQR